MAEHKAIIRWNCAGPDFIKGKYSREHTWTFDGGVTVAASPSAEEQQLHHEAHEQCYIANSIKTEVRAEASNIW